MEFVRFGGLSKVNQKKVNKIHRPDFKEVKYYHQAPCNKGIYAFIYPYIENFLWSFKANKIKEKYTGDFNDLDAWNIFERKEAKQFQKEYRRLRKKFKYNGMLWCHFTEHVKTGRRVRDWVEVHTRDLERILKKVKHQDIKSLVGDFNDISNHAKDPYKRGLNGAMSRDHLEVFIEKVN